MFALWLLRERWTVIGLKMHPFNNQILEFLNNMSTYLEIAFKLWFVWALARQYFLGL